MPTTGRRRYSTNLVGIATELLANTVFNDYSRPLHIAGVCEANPALFEMLRQATDAADAAEAFEKYMCAVFGIDADESKIREPRRGFRSSYRQLLEGWGFDANGPAGAVLKGWVQSRFGIPPVFHKTPIGRVGSQSWATYVEEKMSSRYHNNSINAQLDLLYEFCQWVLSHFLHAGQQHVTLYRGVNDFAEHEIVARPQAHKAIVHMNNLTSFTADRSIADSFGDIILEASVPVVKILFFRNLLPAHPLTGEAEYLVIGGDYELFVTDF